MRTQKFLISTILFLSITFFSFGFEEKQIDEIFKLDLRNLEANAKQLEQDLKKNKTDPDLNIRLGFLYYTMMAFYGKPTSEKAIKYFEETLKSKPDPVIKAFLGVAYSARGGESSNLGLVNRGFKFLDEGVNESGNNWRVLSLRIANGLAVPDFLYAKRETLIKNDIALLDKMYEQRLISEEVYINNQFDKSIVYEKEENLEEAKKIWLMITEKYPDLDVAKEAQKKLESVK